jgi:hypothetical protein
VKRRDLEDGTTPSEPVAPEDAPTVWSNQRTWLIVIALVAAVAAVGVFAAVRSGGSSTFTVKGKLVLVDMNAGYTNDGGSCGAVGGYSDINSGAEVTIDLDNKPVAVGTLGTGRSHTWACAFPFTVPGVPVKTGAIYGLDVSNRGQVHYTLDKLRAGPELSLGSVT